MVGVDHSEHSQKVISTAIEYKKAVDRGSDASSVNVKIIVFHSTNHHMIPRVLPLPMPTVVGQQYTIPTVDYEEIEHDYKVAGQQVLDNALERFKKENIFVETRLIEDDSPEDYIKKVIKEENIDLVILGKGQKSGLEHFFLGSVSEHALKHALCDVLIVK